MPELNRGHSLLGVGGIGNILASPSDGLGSMFDSTGADMPVDASVKFILYKHVEDHGLPGFDAEGALCGFYKRDERGGSNSHNFHSGPFSAVLTAAVEAQCDSLTHLVKSCDDVDGVNSTYELVEDAMIKVYITEKEVSSSSRPKRRRVGT